MASSILTRYPSLLGMATLISTAGLSKDMNIRFLNPQKQERTRWRSYLIYANAGLSSTPAEPMSPVTRYAMPVRTRTRQTICTRTRIKRRVK